MTENKQKTYLTEEQSVIAAELCSVHGLDPEQISFHGTDNKPIFDYEAINALSLILTDIKDIKTRIIERTDVRAKAECLVTLPDGRTRSIEETAYLNEPLGATSEIDSMRLAEQVAQSRAARRGIRSVGINLYNCHKKMIDTGEIAQGHLRHDPRNTEYQEIKTIAKKIGLIFTEVIDEKKVENREQYDRIVKSNFDVESISELDDVRLQKCKILFRSLDRTGYGKVIKQTKQAA